MSSQRSHREIELKFRVHALFELPDLGENVEIQPQISLNAVYHDTSALTLFRWRVTLRRREGGLDAGWHLKLPVINEHEGVRDELHAPLSAGAIGQVPAELADIIAPLVGDQPLIPVIELRTQRVPRIFSDTDGHPLIELVDDTVHVVDQSGATVLLFREIEIELLDNSSSGARSLMAELSERLLAAGAESGSMSKAAAALGPRAAAPCDVPIIPLPTSKGMAADAIRSTVAGHVRDLLFADVDVRRNLPDAVHQLRVSARRLRSVFRTFAPLLESEWSANLSEELSWLANEMSLIRDSEVLEQRLLAHATLIPAEESEVAVTAIRVALDQRIEVARAGALAAIRSDRHMYLIEDLIEAARAPHFRDTAYQACEDVLPQLVSTSWRTLRKSCANLRIDGPAADWHRARIKAKRARYAVDAIAGMYGTKAAKFSKSLGSITELLGDHQDAYVAQEFLRELASQNTTDGITGYALGLLHGIEVDAEMDARLAFAQIWEHALKAAHTSELVKSS